MLRSAWCARTALVVALFVMSVPMGADAQSTASISGVVKDTDGSVLPGVTVVVRDDASGVAQEVTTDGEGRYQATALGAGSYTVSASLAGFKTATAKSVRVAPGQPVAIALTLEIGQLEETVIVTSSAELVNSQNGTVAATLNSDQLTRLPTPTRNALNAVAFLPGVNTTGTNRDSTINGLPESFISITLDGVSNNDNFLRNTDSFFASVTPRQDAVEAVSVTLSSAGAQVGGGAGAVTMAFQTRSGGNRFTGSAYEYYRNPSFNTNYVFNEINHQPKNEVKLNQFGARTGGPIVLPGLYDGRNQAFFFVHYEQIRFPNSFTRTRVVYNPRVYDGWFRYQFGNEVREINLLDLAARNGQLATKDPMMTKIMGMIDAATKTAGTRAAQSDPLYDNYVWQSPSELFEHQPTVRLDYNVSNNHRLTGSWSSITAKRTPDYLNNADPRFPGAPNQRDFVSTRPLTSLSMRSVLTKNMINELRGGLTAYASGSNFGYPSAITSRNDPGTFADQGGFAIQTAGNTNDWFTSNTPSWRKAPTYSIEDTLTWNKGAHTIMAGGNFLMSNASSEGQTMVQGITLGFNTDFDPAAGLFTTANFPGASGDQLAAARATYANLTGRVATVSSTAVLQGGSGQYEELAPTKLEGGFKVFGSFIQDTWRLKPNLTLTGGLRYDIMSPFEPFSSVMSAVTIESVCGRSGVGDGGAYSRCNFLAPGTLGGTVPQYIQFEKGTAGYETDLNNIAPSVAIAWRPNVQSGFMRTLFGDPDQATFRAGYSVAYDRQGLTRFTDLYGGNRGASVSLNRTASTGTPTLVPAGESWPVLLSQTSRLYPSSFNADPRYPIALNANRADSLNAFAPDIEIARVRTWTVAFAREISRDMAVEIRYVGNRGENEWGAINYNSIRTENLAANGFMNEFKVAMANLAANNASGVSNRGGSFAYFGQGSGTSPLPIYLAYLNGRRDADNPAAYGLNATGGTLNPSTTYTNATIAGRLAAPNPNPTGAAGDLDGNLTRRNQAQALGYPVNFFVLNPDAANVNVTDGGAFSKYNALQLELRRRLSKGFSANVNYQYAFEGGSQFDGFSFGRAWTDIPVTDNPTVRHAIKFQADWTLPIGRGERYAGNIGAFMDALIGGWSVTGVGRFQTTVRDLGNVNLVGMSVDDLQDVYKFYRKGNSATGIDEIWMLPDDIVLNTRRAFSTSNSTANGYSTSLGAPEGRYIAPANSANCIQMRPGDCAPRSVLLLSPWFKRVDFGVAKRVGVGGTRNFEVRFDLLNVFDSPNYTPVNNPGSGENIFRTTAAYTDASNTYDPGGRIGQLMFRFNW